MTYDRDAEGVEVVPDDEVCSPHIINVDDGRMTMTIL